MTLKGIVGSWWRNAHCLKKNLFYACKTYMSVTKAGIFYKWNSNEINELLTS